MGAGFVILRSRIQAFLSDHLDLFYRGPVFKSSAMLLSLPPVGFFKTFMSHLSCYLLLFTVSTVSTAVLNALTLK